MLLLMVQVEHALSKLQQIVLVSEMVLNVHLMTPIQILQIMLAQIIQIVQLLN